MSPLRGLRSHLANRSPLPSHSLLPQMSCHEGQRDPRRRQTQLPPCAEPEIRYTLGMQPKLLTRTLLHDLLSAQAPSPLAHRCPAHTLDPTLVEPAWVSQGVPASRLPRLLCDQLLLSRFSRKPPLTITNASLDLAFLFSICMPLSSPVVHSSFFCLGINHV